MTHFEKNKMVGRGMFVFFENEAAAESCAFFSFAHIHDELQFLRLKTYYCYEYHFFSSPSDFLFIQLKYLISQ